MKYFFAFLTTCLLTITAAQAEQRTFGAGVTINETIAVSTILDKPEQYVGQQVRIEGIILDVCSKRGCWIYVASDRQGEKIQVKVTDGEIVFPMAIAGRLAAVEGIVEILDISKEQMIAYLQHIAEEKGQPFDPSTVKAERMIRLVGLGAQLLD
ncbi:MAG: DUF4920 domain-containing protein [Desulfobulbaceae bacterium]|nr:MAG: DUF4920 domain-containing protein [Desulfobulbaceae bacterium]